MWSLCVLYHRLLDLRRPEVKALANLFSLEGDSHPFPLEWGLPLHHHHLDLPFHLVSLPSELIACNIANRSMLVKGIYELCGEGRTCDELEEAISDFWDEQKLPFLSSESSFKVVVDSFGRVLSLDEQNGRIQSLAYIPFKGVDIDIRVVRVGVGRGPDCNVWSNFNPYGLSIPISLLRSDKSLPPWRSGFGEFVLVGKSGGRKLLKRAVSPYTVPDEKREDLHSIYCPV